MKTSPMKYFSCILCSLLLTAISFRTSANKHLAPPDTTATMIDKTTALVLIEQGKELLNAGRVRDALTRFRESGQKDPTNWKSPYWVSQCNYIQNNYGLALKNALEAKEKSKDEIDNDLYELLARTYHRNGMLDSALRYYTIALEKLPEFRKKDLQIGLRIEQCNFAITEMNSGKISKRVAFNSLNSGVGEYCPILVKNGKEIYFTSRRSDTKGGNMNPEDQDFFEDVYLAKWNEEQNDWDSVTNELGRINSDGFDAITYISPDGLKGLMTINTTATDAKETTKSSDIFTIDMTTKGKWSSPKFIDSKTINSTYYDGSATMTPDGNTMYFVSDRKGDKSSTDIYVVKKIGKEWGEAEPLPFTINTIGRETTPYITPDGRYLFFSSDGHKGMGGLDIYVVENTGSGWGTPENLGIIVNTVNNDTHFQYYPSLKKAVMAGFTIIGQKASMDIFEIDMSDFTYPAAK